MATTCNFGQIKDLRLKSLCIGSTVVIDNDRNILARKINAKDICISNDLTVDGNAYFNQNIIVYGDQTLLGNLEINEDLTVCGDQLIKGNLEINKNLIVYGDETTISGNISIDGNLILNENAIICGDQLVKGNLTVNENATICGDQLVKGNLNVNKISAPKVDQNENEPEVSLMYMSSDNILATYDVLTNVRTIIGDMGQAMLDIAITPTGELYGIGFDGNLYLINTTNANITLRGSTTPSNGLASDINGTLYSSDGAGNLYTVNKLTGATTLVAALPGSPSSVGDLSFIGEKDLYLTTFANTLYYIDIDNPPASFTVGPTLPSAYSRGLAELFFGGSAKLYGAVSMTVYEIDRNTGSTFNLQNVPPFGGPFINGIASQCWASPSLPTSLLQICADQTEISNDLVVNEDATVCGNLNIKGELSVNDIVGCNISAAIINPKNPGDTLCLNGNILIKHLEVIDPMIANVMNFSIVGNIVQANIFCATDKMQTDLLESKTNVPITINGDINVEGSIDMYCGNIGNVQALFVDQLFGKNSPINVEDSFYIRDNASDTGRINFENDILIGMYGRAINVGRVYDGSKDTTTVIGHSTFSYASNSTMIGRYSYSHPDATYCIGIGTSDIGKNNFTTRHSITFGTGNYVVGEASTCIGSARTIGQSVYGNFSVGLGPQHSIGKLTGPASGRNPSNQTIAIGNGANAGGNTHQSIVIGVGADAADEAEKSICVGAYSVSSATNTIAIGTNSKTYGDNGIAIGKNAYCAPQRGIAIGSGDTQTLSANIANPNATAAVAIGNYINDVGAASVTIGYFINTKGTISNSGIGCVSIGVGHHQYDNYASYGGRRNVNIGNFNYPHGRMYDNVFIGSQVFVANPVTSFCVAMGLNPLLYGGKQQSRCADGVVIGQQSEIHGYDCIAIGALSISYDNGTCLGADTYSDVGGVAIGRKSQALNYGAIAIGGVTNPGNLGDSTRTNAGGYASIAIGRTANTTAGNAIAFGTQTYVSSNYGVAIGHKASVSGNAYIQLGENVKYSGGDARMYFRSQEIANEEWIDGNVRLAGIDDMGNIFKSDIILNDDGLEINGNLTVNGTAKFDVLDLGNDTVLSNINLGVGPVLITNYMELNIGGTIYKIPIGL